MREAFALQKFSHYFNKKYCHIREFNFWKFNETLTNDVVSFEQPGPEKQNLLLIENNTLESLLPYFPPPGFLPNFDLDFLKDCFLSAISLNIFTHLSSSSSPEEYEIQHSKVSAQDKKE